MRRGDGLGFLVTITKTSFSGRLCTILVLAGTSTANTLMPLLLQQFLFCSLFTWTVTFWLVCNTKGIGHFTYQLSELKITDYAEIGGRDLCDLSI